MTSTATEAGDTARPFVGLEVATVAADALRANVRVSGELQATTAPLLTSVLRTHMTAGRRYLRVDLTTAVISDPAVVELLVGAHLAVTELGGMLMFENAGAQVLDAVRRSASLYVRSVAA